ncbi:putative Syntaxin [Hypsibius exemplaris]|uniref:Syntaxin n=1 Tax=Hypsibius exemplaris TaxID=2072580 RepID=A0A9X6RN37_HYPEX|nr:putative Syntaxin [Hypsibius exemplaris]
MRAETEWSSELLNPSGARAPQSEWSSSSPIRVELELLNPSGVRAPRSEWSSSSSIRVELELPNRSGVRAPQSEWSSKSPIGVEFELLNPSGARAPQSEWSSSSSIRVELELLKRSGVRAPQFEWSSSTVENVGQSIDAMAGKVEHIKQTQQTILASALPDPGLHEALQRHVQEFRSLSLQVRSLFSDLDKDIKHAEQVNDTRRLIIGRGQRASLGRRLADTIAAYSRAEVSYRNRCAARLRRQIQIVGTADAVTDQQLDDFLHNGTSTLFTQGIISESENARQTLRDLDARHFELLSLERSIAEVRDLFMDVSVLVESQGETVSKIETTISMTRDDLSDAGSLLKEAQRMRKTMRHRKVKLALFAVILVLLIALTIFLAVYFGKK